MESGRFHSMDKSLFNHTLQCATLEELEWMLQRLSERITDCSHGDPIHVSVNYPEALQKLIENSDSIRNYIYSGNKLKAVKAIQSSIYDLYGQWCAVSITEVVGAIDDFIGKGVHDSQKL